MNTAPVKITPPRLSWLIYLDRNGETAWRNMPGAAGTSWQPMVEAGLIESRYCREAMNRYFKITDAGRQVLAKHQQ